MKILIAISLATVYGLSIRLFFGFLDGFMGIMSLTFLIFLPMIIGFLTVIMMPRKNIRNSSAAFFMPWATSLAILFFTILFGVEGTICWVLIFPFFAILAGIGGVIAFNRKKRDDDKDPHIDNWEDPNKLKISLILLAVPLLLGLLEGDRTLSSKNITITKQIIIPATPAAIWKKIIAQNEIIPQETQTGLSSFLGFPKHLQTTLDTAIVGGKRKAIYENGLTFDEVISTYQENKMMVLDIKTDASKIPANVLDEHIAIGGKHVDILQDSYNIEQLADGTCKLSLSSKFVITTPFNWYASIWSNFLMADLLHGELKAIKQAVVTDTK